MLLCPVCESIYPGGAYDRCPQDGAPLYVFGEGEVKRPHEPGDVVAGKFEIIEEIARRGGAGRTFRAHQRNLEREVELRILPADSLVKPGDQARFQREVETWGKLRSDYLVRLYDSGFTEDGAPYMALEYVPGGTLGQRLRIAGPLSDATLRVVAEHALKALGAAHDAGVLHRDVSPDALVLGKRADGRPYCRVTGFGLAKLMGDMEDDPTAITMTGQVIGNPAYMAPETIMMGVLDPRTDLYTLGVTLYELATGRRPFQGQSLAEMLAAHVQGTPDPIRRHRPDVDAPFERLVTRLLAKDPEVRYQSAAEALAALRNDISAWPAPPAGSGAPAAAGVKPRKSLTRKPKKAGGGAGKVLLWVLVAVLSAGVLGAGLGYLILWLRNAG